MWAGSGGAAPRLTGRKPEVVIACAAGGVWSSFTFTHDSRVALESKRGVYRTKKKGGGKRVGCIFHFLSLVCWLLNLDCHLFTFISLGTNKAEEGFEGTWGYMMGVYLILCM